MSVPKPKAKLYSEFQQTLVDSRELSSCRIRAMVLKENFLTKAIIAPFGKDPAPIGLSPGYSDSGNLVALAISTSDKCLTVEFFDGRKSGVDAEKRSKVRDLLEEHILCRPSGDLYAFDFGPLAMALFTDIGLRITGGVDIQSAFDSDRPDRRPLAVIKQSIGPDQDDITICTDNILRVFTSTLYSTPGARSDLVQRAWISRFLPSYQNGAETFDKVGRIDTKNLSDAVRVLNFNVASYLLILHSRLSL